MSVPMWFGVVFAALAILVPVIASAVLCAPKWWDSRVQPHLPGWMDAEPDIDDWYFAPLRWVINVARFLAVVVVAFPVFFVGGLAIRYGYAWTSWIERKCPYTPAEVAEDYYSHQRVAVRFRDGWRSSFGKLWNEALGRN